MREGSGSEWNAAGGRADAVTETAASTEKLESSEGVVLGVLNLDFQIAGFQFGHCQRG